MTYFLTALSNDKAQLIMNELQTTDKEVAEMAKSLWQAKGFKVVERQEG